MKSRLVLTTLAALGLFIIDGVAAKAAPPEMRYYIARAEPVAEQTKWANAENWSAASCTGGDDSGAPASTDHIIICQGKETIFAPSADASFLSIEVQQGATMSIIPTAAATVTISDRGGLEVRAGGILTLDAVTAIPTLLLSNGGTYNIDGTLRLEDSGVILRFSQTSILDGSGMIEAQNDGVDIQIDSTKELTVNEGFRIEGNLEIKENVVGDGTDPVFRNDGLVNANASGGGIILLTALTHRGTGEFRISGNAANEINFASGDASNMATFFNLRKGFLDIDIPFYTSGGLRSAEGGTANDSVQCLPGAGEQCVFAGSGE